tara:strand:+ start:766 stop:1029 length:264 start_codon:yes stop_codon:yes gene_type:complete
MNTTIDEPIKELMTDRQNLEGLKFACKVNKENGFNSLKLLVPIAKEMLSNMDSDELLEFIEHRYNTLTMKLETKYFYGPFIKTGVEE